MGVIWFHFTINENKNSPVTAKYICLQLYAWKCCGNYEIYLKMKFYPGKNKRTIQHSCLQQLQSQSIAICAAVLQFLHDSIQCLPNSSMGSARKIPPEPAHIAVWFNCRSISAHTSVIPTYYNLVTPLPSFPFSSIFSFSLLELPLITVLTM